MGSKASKPVQAAARKFPSRPTGSVPPSAPPRAAAQPPLSHSQQAQAQAPSPKASSLTKDESILRDGADPDQHTPNAAFSRRLRQMGIADPNPTLSNSSTVAQGMGPDAWSQSPMGGPSSSSSSAYPPRSSSSSSSSMPPTNRTLSALAARQRIQRQVDEQFENPTAGREFVDVGTLRQVLAMRERGAAPADIERRLRLKDGVVARLGQKGVVTPLSG